MPKNPLHKLFFLLFPEAQKLYQYIAVVDDRICSDCLQHQRDELYTLDKIRRLFPYRIELSPTLILPMVHPNCRCMLVLWAEE